MKLTHFAVQNYRSLRGVSLKPGSLNVIVGANAAGKSNLADSLDFLSEVYRHGLELSVARKGGYENIAFRRVRRAKGAIRFEIAVEVSSHEIEHFFPVRPAEELPDLLFQHSFSFVARGYAIRAEFSVEDELLEVKSRTKKGWKLLTRVKRGEKGRIEVLTSGKEKEQRKEDKGLRRYLDFTDLRYLMQKSQTVPPTELFVNSVGRYTIGLHSFIYSASGVRVFRVSPDQSRKFAAPTPRPELEVSGENLPAVVDRLKKDNPSEWELIVEAMRAVMPKLQEISVEYTTTRTLGLVFAEEGIGRPWSSAEVSDGTIQTLALLVAVFDTRYSALVIEEPENSVHPWIIRNFLEACKQASRHKQIIITTHSPVVINSVSPDQVFVIWRHRGESHLAPMTELDPGFMELWEKGKVSTFGYLDSGAMRRAIPPSDVQPEFWDE